MEELVRCLSDKEAAKVYQLICRLTLQYFTQKIISFPSHQQLIYHHLILAGISAQSSSLLSSSPDLQISLNYQLLQMVIISPFMNTLSTEGIIRIQKVNCQTIDNLMIAQLGLNLLDELLKINRPYFPTCQNIYLYDREISLNQISFVGVSFVEFKTKISKIDFLEICQILPAKMLNGRTDYVIVKQTAILVFILRLIFMRDGCLANFKKISDFVTIQEATILLQVQRQRRRKYFSNSKIIRTIRQFQKETGMNLLNLVNDILINEEEMSWPNFISKLLKPKVQHVQMQANLEFLANYHWNQMKKIEKTWLINIKFVSIKQISEEFDRKDTDFVMMILTKTRFSLLLSHSCLSTILMNQTNFDMMGYKLWLNFLKIIPFDNEAFFDFLKEKQSKKQGHQCHVTGANGTNGDHDKNYENQSNLLYIGNLPFLIEFTSKKLRNVIKREPQFLIFQHSQLTALKDYQSAFR